jgi:sulfite reductase alpha subunit-like flavoprotein
MNDFVNNISENINKYGSAMILYVITCTFGSGKAPTNASDFLQKIKDTVTSQTFANTPYCVLGVGSSAYGSTFCRYAISVNEALIAAGCKCHMPLRMADVANSEEFEHAYLDWISEVSEEEKLHAPDGGDSTSSDDITISEYYITKVPKPVDPVIHKLDAQLVSKKHLEPDLILFTFAFDGLEHGVGWHANIYPQNNEEACDQLISSLRINGESISANQYIHVKDADFNVAGKLLGEGPICVKDVIMHHLENCQMCTTVDDEIFSPADEIFSPSTLFATRSSVLNRATSYRVKDGEFFSPSTLYSKRTSVLNRATSYRESKA